MKKIKYFLSIFVCLFSVSFVYAKDDIKKITMDIYVDSFGNARVKEEWTASITSGTEGYKPYYNLGNSEIIDYKVSMGTDSFTTIDNWDIDASFNEKAYKSGINYLDNGVELCFGISKYGENVYTMEYTITNFVSTVEDADMIYWQLIPYDLSSKPNYVYIKIYSDFAYADDLPVWGYGNYGGYAYVYDGYIELIHEDELDSDEYMVVLAKFPKGTFNTSSSLDENFTYYLDMAEDGATAYSDKLSFIDIIASIIGVIVSFVPFIIMMVTVGLIASNYNDFGTKKMKFSKDAKKIKDAPYFRDIPLNKDIFASYWVAGQYKLIKNKTDFLGAILLKWLKNGNVENTTIQNKRKEERAIKLISNNNLSLVELELYDMMYTASADGVLESNEFTNWCKKNYNKILKWFNKVVDDATMQFVNCGLITEEQKTFSKAYIVSPKLDEYALQMSGLKKFLNDFSNIKDRESIEVKLWDEYLIYAQIFGIAEKVAKEFKKLYPDVITDEYYNDIIFIHTISYQGVHAASLAKSRAESYSAGGGGFSSSGGGGGSFGGGGGGGGFR